MDAGIVVLLLLFVVRPLIRNLTNNSRTIVGTLPPGAAMGADGTLLPAGLPALPLAPGVTPAVVYEQQVAQARGLVAKDPARVAQVVKDWVQAND